MTTVYDNATKADQFEKENRTDPDFDNQLSVKRMTNYEFAQERINHIGFKNENATQLLFTNNLGQLVLVRNQDVVLSLGPRELTSRTRQTMI